MRGDAGIGWEGGEYIRDMGEMGPGFCLHDFHGSHVLGKGTRQHNVIVLVTWFVKVCQDSAYMHMQ